MATRFHRNRSGGDDRDARAGRRRRGWPARPCAPAAPSCSIPAAASAPSTRKSSSVGPSLVELLQRVCGVGGAPTVDLERTRLDVPSTSRTAASTRASRSAAGVTVRRPCFCQGTPATTRSIKIQPESTWDLSCSHQVADMRRIERATEDAQAADDPAVRRSRSQPTRWFAPYSSGECGMRPICRS